MVPTPSSPSGPRKNLRLVFMGTPGFAVASLDALCRSAHEVVAVVTATDKPGGRGRQQMVSSPVKEHARAFGIPVLQPERLKDPGFLEALASLQADLFVVVAFRMLPETVWNMPRLGTINLHGSLLPAYRGAAPIHWAVLNGDRETGVTIFQLRHDIDTGDILLRERLPIDAKESTGSLHDRMMWIGARALVRGIHLIASGESRPMAQLPDGVSHAPKIYPETARLDFTWPVSRLHNWIRGMNPFPSAWFEWEGHRIKIHTARCLSGMTADPPGTIRVESGEVRISATGGAVIPLELQAEGRKRMPVREFVNGNHWSTGIIGHISSIEIPS